MLVRSKRNIFSLVGPSHSVLPYHARTGELGIDLQYLRLQGDASCPLVDKRGGRNSS